MRPVGLLGELTSTALVAGRMACSIASMSRSKSSALSTGHEHAEVIAEIVAVLHEVGLGDDHFVARVEDGAKDDVERAAGSDRHDHVVAAHGDPLVGSEIGGHCLAGLGVARVLHVAMPPGRQVAGHFLQHPPELLGRLHVGVPDAEIEDLVSPVDGGQTHAFLEHLPDPGGGLGELDHPFGHCPVLGRHISTSTPG